MSNSHSSKYSTKLTETINHKTPDTATKQSESTPQTNTYTNTYNDSNLQSFLAKRLTSNSEFKQTDATITESYSSTPKRTTTNVSMDFTIDSTSLSPLGKITQDLIRNKEYYVSPNDITDLDSM